jgi:tetratricopeptide (TPR) repeat protein
MYHVGRGQKQKIKAETLATDALRIAPDLAEAHMAKGFSLRMTERNYDAALKELSTAVLAAPNDPELLENIGGIYRRQGRWREALATYRRVQALDPRTPHSGEAQTATILRDWNTAIGYYRHQLDIDPDDVGSKMTLADVLMTGPGDFRGARAVLDQLPKPLRDNAGNPSGDDIIIRWELSMLERDFAGAEKVVAQFPGEKFRPPFVGWKSFALGCTALAAGDSARAHALFEKARPDYEALVQDHPDEPKFLARLGLLYAYLGRKEDALRQSHRAVDLWPENEAVERPIYLGNLALVYALSGESEEAVTLLEQLLTAPAAVEHPITLSQLRSWRWDGLRNNPRFQKILAAPEPKTIY